MPPTTNTPRQAQTSVSGTSATTTEKLDWCVYMIEACDSRLYTGITNNLLRRWQAHCNGKGGAKFFRGRKPRSLCYLERGHNRSSASRREAAIKKLNRRDKERLIAAQPQALRTELRTLIDKADS